MVEIHIDDDLVVFLRESDKPVEQTAREMIVLGLYRRKTISSGEAAELLDMPRSDFVRYASDHGIPSFDLTPKELKSESRGADPA